MGRAKIDPTVEGEVRGLIVAGWSERLIIDHFKKRNIKLSKGTINRIKNRDRKEEETTENRRPKGVDIKKLDQKKIKKLKLMAENPNPKPQKEMGRILQCSQQNISYHINKTLKMKIKIKPRVHQLSALNIKNRAKRSLNLYKILNNQKWRKVITTDEAWFYVNEFNGKRRIQYISRDNFKRKKIENFVRSEKFSQGFMVWAGISARGKTKLHFVTKGAKINSDYYINNVLKPFWPEIYPVYILTNNSSSIRIRPQVIRQRRHKNSSKVKILNS